jgi:DNA modification methylase
VLNGPINPQIWRDQHVFFADARNMDAIGDGAVDFFITSPPYWDLKQYGESQREIGKSGYEKYLDDLTVVFSECYRKARDGAVLVVNVNSRRSKGIFYPIAFDIVRVVRNWTFWDHNIWYVPNALPQPNHYIERLLDNKYESLLVFIKGDPKGYKCHKPRVPQKYITADPRAEKKNARGRCLGNILRIPAYRPPNIKSLNYHIAAYPEELVAFFLETYTDAGDAVLDPFLGSGTTLKVSRVMGRKGIGFEVHREYAPLIEARINEEWQIPDWKSLDILHSATNMPGMNGSRKAHFSRASKDEGEMLL